MKLNIPLFTTGILFSISQKFQIEFFNSLKILRGLPALPMDSFRSTKPLVSKDIHLHVVKMERLAAQLDSFIFYVGLFFEQVKADKEPLKIFRLMT